MCDTDLAALLRAQKKCVYVTSHLVHSQHICSRKQLRRPRHFTGIFDALLNTTDAMLHFSASQHLRLTCATYRAPQELTKRVFFDPSSSFSLAFWHPGGKNHRFVTFPRPRPSRLTLRKVYRVLGFLWCPPCGSSHTFSIFIDP